MKHTPGPWEARFIKPRLNTPPHVVKVWADEKGRRCTTYIADVNAVEECDANTSLIAAAPDLLAACKSLIAEVMVDRIHEPRSVREALAAIAKARGERSELSALEGKK